jgi:hypothetical protein
METIETFLEKLITVLQSLEGAPASVLVILLCIIVGYIFRFIKSFPNDAVPVVVILLGGMVYPWIADGRNIIPLRVWNIRSAIFGLVLGFIAWMAHKYVISYFEDFLAAKAKRMITAFQVSKLRGVNTPLPKPPGVVE